MIPRERHRGESGAILIIFMVVLAVAAIALTAAAQAWSTTWRRDSEEELIFRANQYVLGIIAYRKEHGGQFPLKLEDLKKPGPRRLRYVRKLYRDPIAKDGKWGLLYLMPGGQGVYDPKAAQVAQDKAKKEWGKDWESAGTGTAQQQMPGVTPLNQNPLGAGVPGTGGMPPGSLAPNMSGAMPMIPPPAGMGGDGGLQLSGDEESVSEPPIGWPIVGVISRATGKSASGTFKIYKGHEQVDEWQFHVFDLGEQVQQPGNPMMPTGPGSVGPGFGGRGAMGGIGGGVQPGMWRGRGANVRDYLQSGSGGGRGNKNYNPQNPYGNPDYDPKNPYGKNNFYPPGTSPPKEKNQQGQEGQQGQEDGDQGNP